MRDLFFFFLQSSQPLTREQVCLVLWPEIEEPERQKLRFKNDLYRLRRAVGQKVILFEDEHYRFNRDLDYEYDVEAFDAYIKQAHSADETAEKIQAYRKAIALVEGPYLQDIDATWAWPERERLNRAYLSALLALAELYLQSGQTGEAITLAQRALEWDSCLEEAHRLLMRAYARQGDRPAIVRQYRTCKDTLRTELDVSPSPETERLYRRLTA
ncbi:MAG: hypothetical protein D6770_11375 [Anaerolineae bacterium]|nr:MAG: hypothetical protein D6770_11375 [Anaerolineae bacterium]